MADRLLLYVIFASALSLLGGCAMSGNYQTARTLDPGTSSVGLTFNVNTLVTDEGNFTIPGLIPELSFHTGITEKLELGGRVALGALGIEADTKYRFFHNDKWHLAIAPAISFQGFVGLNGLALRVPLIATVDISKRIAWTGALFGSYTHFSVNASNDQNSLKGLLGDQGVLGISIGPEIRGDVFFFRPAVELSHHEPFNKDSKISVKSFQNVAVLINLAWLLGKEKKQLDAIEKKIDEINKK